MSLIASWCTNFGLRICFLSVIMIAGRFLRWLWDQRRDSLGTLEYVSGSKLAYQLWAWGTFSFHHEHHSRRWQTCTRSAFREYGLSFLRVINDRSCQMVHLIRFNLLIGIESSGTYEIECCCERNWNVVAKLCRWLSNGGLPRVPMTNQSEVTKFTG